jgi:predicted ATPase
VFTEIRATNFKSWARLAPGVPADDAAQINSPGLPLGKVTGIFGANSSGKTSILQVLLLLKQSMESANRQSPLDLGDSRSPVRIDTFTDILRDHDSGSMLGLGFSWKGDSIGVPDPVNPHRSIRVVDEFSFDTQIYDFLGTMLVRRFQYIFGVGHLSYQLNDHAGRYDLTGTVDGYPDYFGRVRGRADLLPGPLGFYAFPLQVNTYARNTGFFPALEFELEKQLQAIHYLGPLRERPEASYTWTGSRQEDVGYSGAETIPALLAAQLSGKRENRRQALSAGNEVSLLSVEEHVAEWLRELGLVHSFRVAPVAEGVNIYRVYVRRSEASPEVLLTDVGFGVSQVLPVLVLLAYVPEGSTVILEQPEIHLHPAVQSGLADVILETALVRNVQVIVESHSEHLLKRIELRVAEEQLANGTPVSADDIRLWFIDQQDSISQAKDLQLNEYGEIVNWPENFFGDRFGETARAAKAALRRRRNASRS